MQIPDGLEFLHRGSRQVMLYFDDNAQGYGKLGPKAKRIGQFGMRYLFSVRKLLTSPIFLSLFFFTVFMDEKLYYFLLPSKLRYRVRLGNND